MQRKLNFSQLELILAIDRCGSIGKAARQLNITQSAASQSLATLEKALGLPLFTRTASGVTGTAFARTLMPDAQMAVDAANRILQTAEAAETNLHQTAQCFSIAAIPSIAERLLPHWSKQLQRLFPKLKISLYQGNHLEVSDWVKQGITDAGFTALYDPDQENIRSQIVRQEELLFVIHRHNSLLRQPELTLQSLATETMIMAAGSEYIMLPLFKQAGVQQPVMIQTQDIVTALNMVRQGLGLTTLARNTFLQADFHDLRLRSAEPPCKRTLQLIHLANNAQQDILAAFSAIIATHKFD